MGYENRNRGMHPGDDKLFAPKWEPIFKSALDDLNYLLERGYGESSATQLVGNRYRLNARQQKALSRMSASDASILNRKAKEKTVDDLEGAVVLLDGFNILILLEGALSGAFVFDCCDGCYRDISGIHGSYKRVAQTQEVLNIIGRKLQAAGIREARWYFDQPVSNSGRLKTLLREFAEANEYPWTTQLVHNPDKVLAASDEIIISSDAWILDHCQQWFNMNKWILEDLEDIRIFSTD